VAAAFAALKNTAKPLPFLNNSSSSSSLMYPPAKIGAGLVQAHAAVMTAVTITPTELPLRSDLRSHTLELNLTNKGRSEITFAVGHEPSVGISLTKAWFRKAYDAGMPNALVAPVGVPVTVPAKSSIIFKMRGQFLDAAGGPALCGLERLNRTVHTGELHSSAVAFTSATEYLVPAHTCCHRHGWKACLLCRSA
jgi:hypothetical protein